jgi:hypothetical protein
LDVLAPGEELPIPTGQENEGFLVINTDSIIPILMNGIRVIIICYCEQGPNNLVQAVTILSYI